LLRIAPASQMWLLEEQRMREARAARVKSI